MTALPKKESVEAQTPEAKMSPDLLWDVLKELGASERHFNNLESEYRKLASIWLLAGFSGMGFILKENPNLGIPREVALAGIGFAASIGIILLWILDLLVYHRLLDASFIEAMRIEALHPELPQVRRNMVRSQAGGDVTTRLRWFYSLLAAAPVAFSAPALVLWCSRTYGVLSALIAAFALVIYVIIVCSIILQDSLNLKKRTQVGLPADDKGLSARPAGRGEDMR